MTVQPSRFLNISSPIPQIERTEKKVKLDIIVPVFNEEAVVPLLIERLDTVFSDEAKEIHRIDQVCYIFIDDGSKDRTVDLLIELGGKINSMRILRFSRNFGHQPAISAGISYAKGDVVGIIDADLQDPPEYLLEMLNSWRKGPEVIYGIRKRRKASIFMKFLYKSFYHLYSFLSPIEVPMDSGDFCLMGKPVIDALKMLPERLRFVRGLRSWVGYDQISIEYNRPYRAEGETKYSLWKLYQLATDGIASLSITPLRTAQILALLFFAISTIIILIGIPIKFRESSLLLGIILFSNSLVLLCIYVIGSYLGRMYLEVKGRPTFLIKQIIEKSPNE